MSSKVSCPVLILFFSIMAAAFAEAQSTAPMSPESVLHEKTVYIPYEKLRNVFEQQGRGVFLPYDEFKKLWDAAQNAQTPKPIESLPVDAMITEMTAVATALDDIVKVEATLSIDLFRDGWHEIPLRLGNAALIKAIVEEQPARILGDPASGYRLLLEKKKPSAEGKPVGNPAQAAHRVELSLHFARGIDKSPGRNSVSFQVPQAPLSRWKIIVSESDAKIDFFPMIAASEKVADTKTETAEPSDVPRKKETVLEAFVGAAPEIGISWTPKAEGASGLEALTSVQLLQNSTIDESVLRTSAKFEYAIGRSSISELSIRVPSDQKIVSVFDPNIRKWSLETAENAQIVRIELFEPADTLQAVQVELEQMLQPVSGHSERQEREKRTIDIPELAAVGAGRQQGILLIRSADELNTETVRSSGLLRMDASELPEPFRQSSTSWDAAYRISSASYHLQLTAVKVEPRITVFSQIGVTLSAESLQTDMMTELNIERTGIFQCSFEIPAESRDVAVTGYTGGGLLGAEIDSFFLSPTRQDGRRTMTVNFRRKAIGRIGVKLTYETPLDEPDLRSPTGTAVRLPIRLPGSTPGLAERSEGRAVLFASNAYRINAVDLEGLQAVSLQQITESGWRRSIADGQLGFLLADTTASLHLLAERRKPQMSLREARTIRIDDGIVRHESDFHFEILFSALKSLRIDVPREISGRLNVRGGDWRESELVPQPRDVAEGCVAWEFARKSDLLGSGVLSLGWEEEIAGLDIGRGRPIDISRLIPKKQQPSDRIWGRIVLSKSQRLDLGESDETAGLKPIDPQFDVPEADRIDDAVAAFEFHDDWKLRLIATQYKLEDVQRTSMERGLVRANLYFSQFGSGFTAQALFRIRSVRQRLRLGMPADSRIADVRINGQSVVLESDGTENDRSRFLIPLNSVPPDTPFLLEIRYAIPEPCKNRIEIPSFPGEGPRDESAVQKVFLAVYLPNDRIPVGYRGNWSKDFSFVNHDVGTGAFNRPPISDLLNGMTDLKADEFPTSGKPFLFSAVHPTEGDSLRLIVCGDSLGLIGFVLVFLSGLLLLRTTWRRRFQIVLGVLACCVLIGFVFTTLADLVPYQEGIGWGVLLVLLCWILQASIQCGMALRKHHAGRKSGNQPGNQAEDKSGDQSEGGEKSPDDEKTGDRPIDDADAKEEGRTSHDA